jgi:hypothetical protein
MSEPAVKIRLDGNGRSHCPGETLSGEFSLESVADDEIKSIELSVLWYTNGKGDADMAVHDFRRVAGDDNGAVASCGPHRFTTVLPNSPLTYDGVILNLRWCVRVRAYLARGREVVGQQQFRLGTVPPAKAVAP